MKYKAIYNDTVIAETSSTVLLEGNHYFPPESLHRQYFSDSTQRSHCPWKGQAHYYSITVDGQTNEAAAWYYPQASEKAKQIEGAIAFWKGVRVEESPD